MDPPLVPTHTSQASWGQMCRGGSPGATGTWSWMDGPGDALPRPQLRPVPTHAGLAWSSGLCVCAYVCACVSGVCCLKAEQHRCVLPAGIGCVSHLDGSP